MNTFKDIHTSFSSIVGVTVFALLASIATSPWWSCTSDAEAVMSTWNYGIYGLGLALVSSVILRHYGHGEKLKYFTELAVRLLLIYVLITIALIKTEGQFYDLSLVTQEHKLSDLEASTFASAFYGYSPTFQSFNGLILIFGLMMICFRNTQRVGNLLLASTLLHTVVLNYCFESCFLMKNGIFLASVLYFIFNDIFELVAFSTRSEPLVRYEWVPIKAFGHLRKSLGAYKAVLLIGLLFFNHDKVLDIKNYAGRNKDNPIAGVWKVADITFMENDMPHNEKIDLEKFDKIIIDKKRFGAVSVDDSLSYFEFIVNPQDNQLEFWNFHDYRQLDLKGKYYQIAPDTLLYLAANNKDSLRIVLTLDN